MVTDTQHEHAATVDLINAAVPACLRAVLAFRQEFGRLPDDRERRLLVDAVVDSYTRDETE